MRRSAAEVSCNSEQVLAGVLSPQQATRMQIFAYSARQARSKVRGDQMRTDATKETLRHESLRALRQRLVPTRCYGSGALQAVPQPAIASRESGSRETSRQSSGPAWSSETRSETPKYEMNNIMYLLTAGSAR